MARSSASRFLGEVFNQRRQGGDVADYNPDVVLDDGPNDGFCAVEIVRQVLYGLDSDRLNNRNEDAESEEAEQDDFLALLYF